MIAFIVRKSCRIGSAKMQQRRVIEELAGWKKQKEKDAETAWNKETLKSGG